MRVGDSMTPHPIVVRLGDSLSTARLIMQTEGFKHLPVVERTRVLGVVTDRDLRQLWEHLDETAVETVMTADPVTVTPGTSIEEAASLMLVKKVGCLPVIDDGNLVGIVTSTDILRALLDVVRVHSKET
jgi:CBS domain-containing protein